VDQRKTIQNVEREGARERARDSLYRSGFVRKVSPIPLPDGGGVPMSDDHQEISILLIDALESAFGTGMTLDEVIVFNSFGTDEKETGK
jgi:hypothetical protein